MYGVITSIHARGIRKSQCTEASRALANRLKGSGTRRAPGRRRPWTKHWLNQFKRVVGALSVATVVGRGRNPRIVQIVAEPLPMESGPQGLSLASLMIDFRTRQPEVIETRVQVTAHALERIIARAKKLSIAEWVDELKPALVALYFLQSDPDLLDDLDYSPARACLDIPTRSGHARVICANGQLRIVTWLHDLDLSDAARRLAAMEWAGVRRRLAMKLNIPDGLSWISYLALIETSVLATEGR